LQETETVPKQQAALVRNLLSRFVIVTLPVALSSKKRPSNLVEAVIYCTSCLPRQL
jgi:hypothetical protein